MKKLKFNVTGMSCAACQAHVEKAVSKVEGVTDVNVNLLANKMTVNLDEGVTNAQEVINAVESAGYGASEIGDKENKTASPVAAAQDESKKMKKRLWWSVGFLIPLFYICLLYTSDAAAVLYLHGTHGEHTYTSYFCRAQKHDDIRTHSAFAHSAYHCNKLSLFFKRLQKSYPPLP